MSNIFSRRTLARNGKCRFCEKTIIKREEIVTTLYCSFGGNDHAFNLCDDCLESIIKLKKEGMKNDEF